MKAKASDFRNSRTCEGTAYSAMTAPLDMAVVEVSGRYPEKGWAKNEISHEMAYVQKGMGSLALRNGQLTELQEGDATYIPPGEWFAWSGNMVLTIACTPSFNKDQYVVEEDGNEI